MAMKESTLTLQDVGVLFGLHVDGNHIFGGVTPGPGISCANIVASVFGHSPLNDWLNGSRLQLTWF